MRHTACDGGGHAEAHNRAYHAPEHRVLADTLEAMLSAWRAGGLAVIGPDDTLDALTRGQVEELLITAEPATLRTPEHLPADAAPGPVDVETSSPQTGFDADRAQLAGELVTRAQQRRARIRFIEDASLLAEAGGVGTLLRFKI